MTTTTTRQRVIGRLLVGVVMLTLGAVSCSRGERALGESLAAPPDLGPTFVVEDAGADAEGGLTSYCPTSNCPPGWTTCPNSRFPCDVNVRTDPNNCGACGRACPGGSIRESFSCIEGVCATKCTAAPLTLDCDGLADTGCEVNANQNNHCGACGKKCSDPAQPCVNQDGDNHWDCGCPAGKLLCGRRCVDYKNDDTNCGKCRGRCDRTGGGAPEYPNAYYGCSDGQCGALKCESRFANCDNLKSNGCETSLLTDANCGACGNACPDGQACRLDSYGTPQCMCPPGQTYCQTECNGDECMGQCVDLTSDRYNCGACGAACFSAGLTNSQRSCSFGSCVMRCDQGRADCNNSQSDGCEVNTDSDPQNCGGCGHVCDAVAGQACVAGQCVVEPCGGEEVGEGAR